jgi:hypothetical protein
MHQPKPLSEHLTLDLDELKKQYKKLRERQRQAHIIIQTASLHNRQKSCASNKSNGSNQQQNLLRLSSVNSTPSSASPFTLESDPIVNHLLIKSNDPKNNTVKKSIHINSPVLTLNDKEALNSQFLFFSKENSFMSEILNKQLNDPKDSKKKPKKKQQKPYYSDDEDDDSDDSDEDDDDESDTDQNDTDENTDKETDDQKNENIFENKSNSSTSSSSSSSTFNSDKVIPRMKPFNDNSVSLSNVSSTCIIQSTKPQPNVLANKNESKVSTVGTNRVDKQHSSSTNSSTSTLIEHLIMQEKRHLAAPINPFPARQINSNIARNGVRLGLYK